MCTHFCCFATPLATPVVVSLHFNYSTVYLNASFVFVESVFFIVLNIMAAANEGTKLLCDAVTRNPISIGDGNDTLTPDQMIKRIKTANNIANWNDENTMSFV